MKYILGGYLANMPSEPMSSPLSLILSSPMSSPILAGISASSRRSDIPCEGGNIYTSDHFVTYHRKEDSDIWWRLSDEYVEEVKLKQVLNKEA
ncbi:2421_t:CDS:2 [Funneliformis mosseae]|uniref:2421_t:CDS:1 n=1 Tax=Funneliformis mosseae TaxID=27381 RepID=A0A9N9HNJ6_FUNMO|nr:2421_t:CDS:2 [Funneliformis mosseae]